jgi:type IV secretion system protein VirB10
MLSRLGLSAVFIAGSVTIAFSQAPVAPEPPATPQQDAAPAQPGAYTVAPGTHIALGMINSVSTKHSSPGDRIYLETVFPIVINNHIVIPPGSYVTGTVTDVKRPGRVRGRGELYVRFDTITLPNGVTRDFRSRLGGIDARADEHLDQKEGKIRSDSNKGGDTRTIAEAAGSGASIGAIAGAAAGHAGMGAGIGGAAGAAAGIAGVLLTRGPEAVLAKGSTVEMVLDRALTFEAAETNFSNAPAAAHFSDGPGPSTAANRSTNPIRRIPF